jgi:integrase/recombinase XerD
MDPSGIRLTGALAPYRNSLWAALLAQGYTPLSSLNQLRLMAHLSRWLDDRRLGPEDLDAPRVEEYLRHRRRSGYTCWRSLRGMKPILAHLRGAGVVPAARPTSASPTPFDVLLSEYEDYLLRERALEPVTARGYLRTVRDFLSTRSKAQEGLCGLSASEVTSFILRSARSGSIRYAKLRVTALRSFLRHLHVRGEFPSDLTGAVPAVAGWRLAGLPKGITCNEVRSLLRSCDRRTHVGRRDFAAILLMTRLGLRAGEVAGLRLDDLDWTRGELVVRGKPRREDRLPLPPDVGRAIAGYLKHSRPRSECRHLFVRVRAPRGPLSRTGVTALVKWAAKRAELPAVSPHCLRHTAATQMLRAGGSLSDVAHVLRHRHIDTTAIYAKVDRSRLHTLARAWPGSTR